MSMFSKDIPSQLSLQSLLRLALHSQLRKGKAREWMAGVYGDILASPLFSIGLLRGVEIHRGSPISKTKLPRSFIFHPIHPIVH